MFLRGHHSFCRSVWRPSRCEEELVKFRLVLHCIMIVTSVVVPLELPMEFTLAVMIIIFMSILLPFADDNDIKYHFTIHLSKHYYVILYMISMF